MHILKEFSWIYTSAIAEFGLWSSDDNISKQTCLFLWIFYEVPIQQAQ